MKELVSTIVTIVVIAAVVCFATGKAARDEYESLNLIQKGAVRAGYALNGDDRWRNPDDIEGNIKLGAAFLRDKVDELINQ